jgi:hypothetical protein
MVRHVTRMGDKNAYRIYSENLKKGDHVEDIVIER